MNTLINDSLSATTAKDGAMLTFESATEADAEELLKIYTPYVEKTAITFEYEVPSLEEFKSRIHNIKEKYTYIKAVKDGEIVGYAYASTFKSRKAYDWSVETTIYLKEECRGCGFGKLLYGELERRLRKMGILNMNACIAAPKGDDPYLTDDSIKFHTALGFTPVGTFHDSGFKLGRWYDMIWMEKKIGAHEGTPKDIIPYRLLED